MALPAGSTIISEELSRSTATSLAACGVVLSPRQLEIFGLLLKGKSNKEIAESLFIVEKTVKFHLTDIYRKLSVSSRTQAVLKFYGARV